MQKRNILTYGGTLLVGLVIGATGAGGSSDATTTASDTKPSPASTVTVTTTTPATPAAAPAAETVTASAVTVTITKAAAAPAPVAEPAGATIEDGTWTVGEDGIVAGTYKVTTRTESGAMCYWKISKSGTNGASIIKNDIVTGGRPTVVLKKGQDFTTQDCGTWAKK